MNKPLARAILAAIFFFSLAGCETISDDPPASLRLRIALPGAPAGDAAGVSALVVPAGMMPAAELIPPPLTDVHHLRISLSNPDEVFYVFGYEPGTAVSLMVVGGDARVIDVEAYLVPGARIMPDILAAIPPSDFSATHYVTVTPLEQRTVSLTGEPMTVTIQVEPNPNLGDVYADAPFTVIVDGESLLLPISPTCPAPNFIWVTVTDEKWGLPFPSFMVPLSSGQGPAQMSITGLPLGRGYSLDMYHMEAEDLGTLSFDLTTSPLPLNVVMNQYTPSSITAVPEKPLKSLLPDDLIDVGLTIDGGIGNYGPFIVTGSSVSGLDTCGGVIFGSTYSFIVPDGVTSCGIHVGVVDCAGLVTEYLQEATIVPNPPADCNDGIDNDLDGFIDYPNDPGCLSPSDTAETEVTLACDDDLDGDGWGEPDTLDPGCSGPGDATETDPALVCDDGLDNDFSPDIDAGDPGCAGPWDSSETNPAIECDDGVDNDGWADIDFADPGCGSAVDISEATPAVECDDGIDNDGWGDIDVADPGCASAIDAETDPALVCDDGMDSDGWLDADSADPGCASRLDSSETDPALICDDGVDNDGWADIDVADTGCVDAVDPAELEPVDPCDDGADNDGWGDIDVADPGCANRADPAETNPAVACDDGADGDGWGDTDPLDPGCSGATDITETDPALVCDDGINNDDWPDIDASDLGCASAVDMTETEALVACDDGLDGDGWGDLDSADPGCGGRSDSFETEGTMACDDGVDNDGWGDADVADPGCADAADPAETDPVMPCDDGADNDTDGNADQLDAGCVDQSDPFEWRIWFVSATGNNATGLDWTNAYTTPQTAIDAAAVGDQVFVRQGAYTGAGGTSLVTMKNGVSLYGGFIGSELDLAVRGNPFDNVTTLNGGGVYSHVVWAAPNSLIDGFAITGGVCACRGAGVYVEYLDNFTLSQCDIYGNTGSAWAGAGIVMYTSNNIMVVNTIFRNNTGQSDYGGAAHQVMSTVTYRNCLFYGNNVGNYYGGAIGARSGGTATVENCTFAANVATGGGSAFATDGSSINVVNSIVAGASLVYYWNGGVLNATYSDFQDGSVSGTGVIAAVPAFTSGPRGNYYLNSQGPISPCIDAGSDLAATLGMTPFTTRNDHAPDAGVVDMGFHYLP